MGAFVPRKVVEEALWLSSFCFSLLCNVFLSGADEQKKEEWKCE